MLVTEADYRASSDQLKVKLKILENLNEENYVSIAVNL